LRPDAHLACSHGIWLRHLLDPEIGVPMEPRRQHPGCLRRLGNAAAAHAVRSHKLYAVQ